MPTSINFNKLVRDKVPAIIQADGWVPETIVLTHMDHVKCLKAKLNEEIAEYMISEDISELADILEVVFDLALIEHNMGIQDLLAIFEAKQQQRGTLREGIFLLRITPRSEDIADV